MGKKHVRKNGNLKRQKTRKTIRKGPYKNVPPGGNKSEPVGAVDMERKGKTRT